MPKEEMSVLDAFMALEDINDEEIEKSLNESKQKRNLTEGKGFNVRDINEMEKAEDFVNQDTKKDVALEVIDVDADSLEHLKKNDEYIGQMILQCNSCKANRFINAEDLVQSEGDDDVYNIEDECPHCHGTGTGFHLIGQVGKVTDEEDEVKFDNDSLTDEEPKLDNEPEEEPVEDENATEETEEDNEEDFTSEEDNGLETDAEDDTADMESTLGDEFDSDDVKYDDTEEEPTKEEDSLTNNDEDKYDEPLTPVEEPEDEDKKKEKKESVEEDIDTTLSSVHDLFENIIEPENISVIEIYDLDSDEPDEPVFKGDYNELPESFLNSEVAEFNVDNGLLIVNIDTEAEIDELTQTVKTALDIFGDDFNDNISVWDQAAGDELFSGTKESVIEEFGHNAFLSFEAPEVLQIFARNITVEEGLKTPYKEDLDLAEPSDKLISDIIEENGLRESRVDKYGTDEYWIADSIRNLEDLDFIYTNYIQNKSTNLQLEFKDVTGYGSEPNYDEDGNIIEEKLDSEEDVRKEAEEALKKNNAEAVIYGYVSNGKFKRVEGDFLIINTDKELGLATELVKAKYKPTGTVKVVYKNDVAEALDFRNRKELKEAILDCDNKGISYQIKRSTKEGYRYTLLKESPAPTEIENTEEDDLDDLEDLDIEIEAPVENNETIEDLQIKLEEIANNIASAVAEKYNANIDQSAILNDMVNDLCISLRMEELGERSNEEFLAELSQEEINAAFDQLNNPEFSNEAIKERIADPLFAAAIEAGEIPGVTLNNTPEEETEVNEESKENESLNEENLYTKLLAKSKKYKGIDPAAKEDEANESLNEDVKPLNKDKAQLILSNNFYQNDKIDKTEYDNLLDLLDTDENSFSKRLVELGIKNEFFKDYNEHIEETLDEAKKDDELPADPEVVKTNVHATLNNLVTDEIEAINGYEEAKAEIADTHIEHKDDIIDTIDHIEDEEQEHIDELIDAASEIPFDKEDHEASTEPEEEVIEEPVIEEPIPEEEIIPEIKEAINRYAQGKPEDLADAEFEKRSQELDKKYAISRSERRKILDSIDWSDWDSGIKDAGPFTDDLNKVVDKYVSLYKQEMFKLKQEPIEEAVDIHIEGNDVTIADDSGEDVAIIPIDPEGEEAPTEETTEEEASEEQPAEDEENSEESIQEFDEKKFENFINEWLDNNLEETKVFETTNGFIKEDNTIVLEGIMHLEDNKDETTSFTLTPKTNLEESVENEIVYENYTVTLNK